mmetsp:Transcript_1090/g.1503  ORF Transcript_1090/g.1503 Transcript_1090/m.1503 type:complete len:187 (-) Transcript_1090:157-717(-)|eukprot:CAMPEP_0168551546 /NCGR_PEP_ID=MMETSP0413-20121227/6231_1 /TAXON_ID=136452 /ORGANISM="Filamoeba nolandi, Strain NC-AS-23-1" /LENGTH=186 /DNA_ID=CAMNT_0008582081 /DNA_START=161 /DNA_END=721 /DNA_ORIENTATION=-
MSFAQKTASAFASFKEIFQSKPKCPTQTSNTATTGDPKPTVRPTSSFPTRSTATTSISATRSQTMRPHSSSAPTARAHPTECKRKTTNDVLMKQYALDLLDSIQVKEEECPICLEEIDVKDRSYLPCFHYFHDECVSKAMKVIVVSGCPLCRAPVNNSANEARLIESLTNELNATRLTSSEGETAS